MSRIFYCHTLSAVYSKILESLLKNYPEYEFFVHNANLGIVIKDDNLTLDFISIKLQIDNKWFLAIFKEIVHRVHNNIVLETLPVKYFEAGVLGRYKNYIGYKIDTYVIGINKNYRGTVSDNELRYIFNNEVL